MAAVHCKKNGGHYLRSTNKQMMLLETSYLRNSDAVFDICEHTRQVYLIYPALKCFAQGKWQIIPNLLYVSAFKIYISFPVEQVFSSYSNLHMGGILFFWGNPLPSRRSV